MKRTLSITLTMLLALTMSAQDMVTNKVRNYPASMPSDDDNIEWRRDIYREVNLKTEENVGLYSPLTPSKNQEGLFTKIFNLAIAKAIPLYHYSIDGNEVFNESSKIDIKDVLRNYHIFFQEEEGQIVVDLDDVPSSSVMVYYIKESVYYDLSNSSFRTKVMALCPVLIEDDEFTDGPTRYPLFWVEYKDLEPYIKEVNIIPNYKNLSMVMPMTDYFALNRYKGDIYKVANARGITLRQTVNSDSAYIAEQQHIEMQLRNVRNYTYNTYYSISKGRTTHTKKQKQHRKIFSWKKRKTENNSEK